MEYNELANKLELNYNIVNNEEQTKAGIIVPFLNYMGYDTTDLTKCGYEQDYTDIKLATIDDPAKCFIVEAKYSTSTTNAHAVEQLQMYMMRNIDFYIGCVWNKHSVSFYEKGNYEPLCTIKLIKCRLAILKIISKESLDKLKNIIGYNEYKTENVIQLLKKYNG